VSVHCERFDRDSLELLYDELDDVSASLLKRHVAECSRCQKAWQRLLEVRAAAQIPLESPEPSVLGTVMVQQKSAQGGAGAGERLGRLVSLVAGYAMRPQLAMAALLVLMIGSSLVFVRSGPGQGDQVAVREVGNPEFELPSPHPSRDASSSPPQSGWSIAQNTDTVSPPPKPESPASARVAAEAAPVLPPSYEEAMAAYQDGRYAEAERLFGEFSKAGGEKAGAAALHEAHAARNGSGCQRASSYYDEVALRFGGSSVASEAAWHAALCYRALGQFERARAHLERLKSEPAYAGRVEKMLSQGESDRVAARAARTTEHPVAAADVASAASSGAKSAAAPAAKANSAGTTPPKASEPAPANATPSEPAKAEASP
jgi:tetratricopeptide (TPR) repeat protein